MLVKIFRSDRPLGAIIIVLLTVILWFVVGFVAQENPTCSTGSVGGVLMLLDTLFNDTPILGSVVSVVLVIALSFFMNLISNRYELTGKNSFLPAFVYVLIAVLAGNCCYFSGELIINTLLGMLIYRLFQLTATQSPLAVIFDSSVLVSVLGIINPFYFSLVVWIWIGVTMFRSFYIRDWLISIIGVFIPLLYTLVLEYVFGLKVLSLESCSLSIPHYSSSFYIILAAILLLFVPAIVFFLSKLSQNIAVVRKMKYQVLTLLGLLLPIAVFSKSTQPFLVIAIPISIVIANFLNGAKRTRLLEVLVVIFIGLSIYYHFR